MGQITDDLLMDSMATSDFTNTIEKGTTFIFGSWICVADGSGVFTSHLAKSKGLEDDGTAHTGNAYILTGDLKEQKFLM